MIGKLLNVAVERADTNRENLGSPSDLLACRVVLRVIRLSLHLAGRDVQSRSYFEKKPGSLRKVQSFLRKNVGVSSRCFERSRRVSCERNKMSRLRSPVGLLRSMEEDSSVWKSDIAEACTSEQRAV